jgi:hypothetical protein
MSLLISGPPRRARERREINRPRSTITTMMRTISKVDILRVLSAQVLSELRDAPIVAIALIRLMR